MDEREPKPDVESDELHESVDRHEKARFERFDDVRLHKLRPTKGGAELWGITEAAGEAVSSLKEATFRDSDDALKFLQEPDSALRFETRITG